MIHLTKLFGLFLELIPYARALNVALLMLITVRTTNLRQSAIPQPGSGHKAQPSRLYWQTALPRVRQPMEARKTHPPV